MREKLNPPTLKLRRTSKKKVTLENLAGRVDSLVVTVDVLAKTMTKGFRRIDEKFDGIDKKFDGIDKKFDGIDKKFDGIDKKFDDLALAVKDGFDEQGQRLDSLENRMAKVEDTLDNFWTKINTVSGDVSKLKIDQRETRSLVDNCVIALKDLRGKAGIVGNNR